jgi:6-pyruvoyltetrahydropterin/6-carboxytetrahydropterin synthase
MLLLKRRYHFSAAHRLHSKQLSDAENATLYGACNRINSHGHNYQFEVWLEGTPAPQTQMILDLVALDKTVKLKVLDVMDHYHLDYDVPYFKTLPSTAENIAQVIYTLLSDGCIPDATVHHVTVYETENNRASYPG